MSIFTKKEKTPEQIADEKYLDALILMRKRNMRDKKAGYDIICEIAETGDLRACVIAGQFCDYALHDPAKAYEWMRPAIEAGDLQARYYYAGMLLRGEPVKKNKKLAIQEFRALADEGVAEAMFVLGQLDEEAGKIDSALDWYYRAYEAGYAPVQKHLRLMKKNGVITDYDLKPYKNKKG